MMIPGRFYHGLLRRFCFCDRVHLSFKAKSLYGAQSLELRHSFTREPDGTETWEAVFLFQGRTWKHKMEVFLEGQPLFQPLLLALKKNQMRWVSGSGLQMLPCWIMALQRRNPSRTTLCIRLSLKGFSSRTTKIILLPCFRISVSLYFLYVPCQQIYH